MVFAGVAVGFELGVCRVVVVEVPVFFVALLSPLPAVRYGQDVQVFDGVQGSLTDQLDGDRLHPFVESTLASSLKKEG